MSRTLILVVAFVALLGGVAWWLLAPRRAPESPSAASPIASRSESSHPNEPAPSLTEPQRVPSTSTASDVGAEPAATAADSTNPGATNTAASTPAPSAGELLAQGMVVDARGVGIAGAELRLVGLLRSEADGQERSLDLSTSAKSGADGSFRVLGSRSAVEARARTQPPRFALRARVAGFAASQELPCRLGDVGLRIVLARAARIEGRVEFGEPLSRRDVEVALEDPRAPRAESGLPVLQVSAESTFAFENLGDGQWNVIVRTRGRQELARVDGIATKSGETTRDPRLDPLRVEARGTFEVSVFTPDGSPAASATVLLIRGDGPHTSSTTLGRTAPGVFLAVEEPGGITLTIEHEGLRNERLEHVSGPTRVDLRPPLSVELELENLPELERDGLGLELTFVEVPRAGDRRTPGPAGISVRLIANTKPTLTILSPGDLAWSWAAIDSTGTETSRWAEPGAPTVRVLDANEPQVLRIRAPDGLWDKLAAGR